MSLMRRAARIYRFDRIANERVREIMNVKKIIGEDIKEPELKWYGDVQRIDDHRLPKKIFNGQPRVSRKRETKDHLGQRHITAMWG